MPDDRTAEAELRELFASWLAAIPRHDADLIGELLADEWVYTDYLGTVRDRAAYLDMVKNVVGEGHQTNLVELTARLVRDDLALVTGRYTSRGVFTTGRVNEQDSRFTALWERRQGGWRALAHQATNVVPDAP